MKCFRYPKRVGRECGESVTFRAPDKKRIANGRLLTSIVRWTKSVAKCTSVLDNKAPGRLLTDESTEGENDQFKETRRYKLPVCTLYVGPWENMSDCGRLNAHVLL